MENVDSLALCLLGALVGARVLTVEPGIVRWLTRAENGCSRLLVDDLLLH